MTTRYKCINNMFGDSLWALAYFTEYLSNSRLVVLEDSTIHKMMDILELKNMDIIKISDEYNFIVTFIAKRSKLVFNYLHRKILNKSSAYDICYPVVSDDEINNYIKKLNVEENISMQIKRYITKDTRYLGYKYNINGIDIENCKLANLLKIKISKFDQDSKKLDKKYVVINLKLKTLKQKFGFKGTLRSSTTFSDISSIIHYLNQEGRDVIVLPYYRKYLSEGGVENIKVDRNILSNFKIVSDSEFVISARNGFNFIPALLGKDCIELNATDIVCNQSRKTHLLLMKMQKNSKTTIESVNKFINSEFLYVNDFIDAEKERLKYKNTPEEIVTAVKTYLRNDSMLWTGDICSEKHLYMKQVPYKIFIQ